MHEALLVIDVQNEYFSGKLHITFPPGSLSHILQAMDAAHAARIPVIVIRHKNSEPDAETFRPGTNGYELHPEVKKRPCDVLIDKTFPAQVYRHRSRRMAERTWHCFIDNRGIHDPDVLRHYRPSGFPSRVSCKIPVRCYWDPCSNEQRRLDHRQGPASCHPRNPANEILPGIDNN